MYLSSIKLNKQSRDTMKALASPAILHSAVEEAFPGSREGKRRLWRIDYLRGSRYLLILSEDLPKLEKLAEKYGYPNEFITKSYNKFLDNIKDGETYRFRITANPTYSKSSGDPKNRGVVHAHKTEPKQRDWLKNKGDVCGFELNNENFGITEAYMRKFRKRKDGKSQYVTLMTVTYEGTLKVINSELLKKSLCTGIGREKAYGMGLLTLMRNN